MYRKSPLTPIGANLSRGWGEGSWKWGGKLLLAGSGRVKEVSMEAGGRVEPGMQGEGIENGIAHGMQ